MSGTVGAEHVTQNVRLLGEQLELVSIGDQAADKCPLPCKGLLVAVQGACKAALHVENMGAHTTRLVMYISSSTCEFFV